MKWQIAWIAFIAACVLAFGWLIYAYFADLVLARSTAEGLEIIAPNRNLLDVLWPLVVAGALGSAIPAWSFIVWIFLRLRDEEREDERQRLKTALETAQQQLASAQAEAAAHQQGREWALRQREAALTQAERQVQQRQRQAEQAQQEAARQIEAAQARAEAAELRAQRATSAFHRVKRKSLLTGHLNPPTRT
ncbi:MAG: hypothetical protein KDJ34_04445 [Candidatus Competibacteraceae bacterium]|nr:hypothetical protein [Candidatus Competibacteraceae bacterium]